MRDAVRAGIENDLGSGSQIDLCIITKAGGTKYRRCAVPEVQLPKLDDERQHLIPEFERGGGVLPDDEITDDSSIASIPGVNGFGNLAPDNFLESARKIVPADVVGQESSGNLWGDLLGL